VAAEKLCGSPDRNENNSQDKRLLKL
jgi:hypothetical protein